MPEGADTSALTRLYEELRRWALDPGCETRAWPRHLGWAVLLRRGMREWLATCGSFSSTTTRNPERQTEGRPEGDGWAEDNPATRADESGPLPTSVQAQMVATLATIVLGRCDGWEERYEHGLVGCCRSSQA